MVFYQVEAGGDRNFSYLIADGEGGPAAVVDPPADVGRYAQLVARHHLSVHYAVITHGHGDHTWGIAGAARRYACKTVGHRLLPVPVDLRVDEGDILPLGALRLEIIYTPGHTEDAICVLCGAKLMTGDTLFVGKVGGTDLGEGARKEFESLHRLMKLPPETEVYPGHDYGVAPSSTIGHERQTNPFILCKSLQEFLDLKANWLEYKRTHGIA